MGRFDGTYDASQKSLRPRTTFFSGDGEHEVDDVDCCCVGDVCDSGLAGRSGLALGSWLLSAEQLLRSHLLRSGPHLLPGPGADLLRSDGCPHVLRSDGRPELLRSGCPLVLRSGQLRLQHRLQPGLQQLLPPPVLP
jgi:hypothetical protein